ncbi:MAG: kelch repeat-containing protein [bacterium]
MKQYKILVTAILFLTVSVIYSQTNEWEIYDEMQLPVARGQIVVNNNVLFILGGYSQELQSSVNWIQKYYPLLPGVWKPFGEMQIAREGFVAGIYQDGVYYCGGAAEAGPYSNGLEKWIYTQNGEVVKSDINFDRVYSAGLISSDKLYLIGGNSPGLTGNLPYIVSFDLQTNRTFVLEDNLYSNRTLPEHQMAALLEGSIYIFGGVINGITQDIYKFDLTSNTLEKLAITLFQPRASGSAVAVPNENSIYIIGGFNENNNSLKSVEIFKLAGSDYEISNGPDLNYARSGGMAAKTSNDIFVMGGFDENGDVVSSVEKLSLSPDTGIPDDINEIISDFKLIQNFPNPFNSTTNISLHVNKETELSLDVYSILGEHLINLSNGVHKMGSYHYQWSGRDKKGNILPSGIYFYKITSDSFSQSKKMVLLK